MADSINMRTVRRIDASVNSIVCSAKQVQLYEHENGSWVKADYAGGFHICSRAASPYFTMVIVTKTSTKLWVEPLLPDLEFEHQPPFLLYRTKHVSMRYFRQKFENEADESVNHSDTPPLLTPAMIALPESWNTSKSSDRERSLPRDIIPNDLNRIETTFDSQPRRGGPITLQEVREALLHVVQHNDMVVREVMEVIWERRGQRRPDGDVNWTANGRWNHIHF
ncbi:unnamed protein product [Notodromas monacha]|uniref:Uncharacterized protein n=1 Tax=Notodromas monacha TaxID=399045 RepID=A0A7R9BRC3_9CRUS|nr:unnamed protein product [Notodromas monacha]CAG0918748.1 unnamed protein product [Notodromas monacha]